MELHSRKNEYRGVNAHLHSLLQHNGEWESFHSVHIVDLVRAIIPRLPDRYRATIEKSLQIREYHTDTGRRIVRRPKPDVLIFDTQAAAPSPQTGISDSAVATMTQPVIDTFDAEVEQRLTTIVIYERGDDPRKGRPITQIELLSPTNKTDAYVTYAEKRAAALKSGLCLVEIDYLHESESPVQGIPSYPRGEADSTAYNITINLPRPTVEEGISSTFGFGVDVPFPILNIPLAGDDFVSLDFGLPYAVTFETIPSFSEDVDYAVLPEEFETYSPTDQERIRQRMAAVAANPSATQP